MIIHTVTSSDTIYSISKQYGVTATRILIDNSLNPSKKLVPGQSLIINRSIKTYLVKGGDTIEQIAKYNNISVLSLLQNNPRLLREKLMPSQILNISYNKEDTKSIAVAAYTGSAPINTVEAYLPNVSMLLVQNIAHIVGSNVLVSKVADDYIALAKKYHTLPIMVLECINEQGKYDENCILKVLESPNETERLINNIIARAEENGFAGVEINAPGINTADKYKFVDMFLALSGMCKDKNLYCASPYIPISVVDSNDENLFDISDYVPLWNYIWDSKDLPTHMSPLNKIEETLNTETMRKANYKLLLGIPTFAIDYWKSRNGYEKSSVNSDEVVYKNNAQILFDNNTHTPYAKYNEVNSKNQIEHTVQYEDARSISDKFDILDKYDLYGVNIMSLEYSAPVLWQILSQRYNILKF